MSAVDDIYFAIEIAETLNEKVMRESRPNSDMYEQCKNNRYAINRAKKSIENMKVGSR